MEQSTTAPRPDRAGPSHDDDGQILSPAQEKLLEQIAARAPHEGAGSEPPPSTTQQNASDAMGISSAAAPASERQQSGDPPQGLSRAQERLIEGARPVTGGRERPSPPADGPAAPTRALVGPLDSVFCSLRWATLLACSILLLLTVTLLATLVNQVRLFPGWLQPIGYVALAVALAVAGWVLYGLGSRFARRVTTPKVRLSVESYLDQTHLLRGLYHHHQLTEVRDQLARLVRAYALTPQQRALLLRCGATHQQLDSLTMGRGRLIDRLADEPPATWIVRCHNEFYAVLNEIARTCCYRAMARLFGTTAIASHGLIDSCLVLCVTLTHLDNLCQIYNVKPRRGDSLRLLAWVVGDVVLTQPIEDLTDTAGDEVTTALGDWLASSSHAAASTIAHALGVVVGKVSNSAVHALLLGRVSAVARGYLIPVRVQRQ